MKIVQYLGGPSAWGDVTPETMNTKGLGGRETALIQLAENWSKQGHEVINFVPTSRPYGDLRCRYVDYRHVADYLRWFGADVCVSWEEPRIFGIDGVAESVKYKVIEMQVAHLQMLNEELDKFIDTYAVLSKWAGGFLTMSNSFVDPRKLKVLPNGVDLSRYHYIDERIEQKGYPDWNDGPVKTGRWRFFYSSSPDRGLIHLLKMWPKIRKLWPNAELTVAYGIENWAEQTKWSHNIQSEMALGVLEGINQPGINYLGKIGQDELAVEQMLSHALLYPCDTLQPTETGCITVVEAGAALSPAIITDCDCLGSEFKNNAAISKLPFDSDHFLDTISSVIENKDRYIELQEAGLQLATQRHWPVIADQWLDMFKENV